MFVIVDSQGIVHK